MDRQYEDAINNWLKFLNPRSLKSNLINASLYLTAWEVFEHGVIGHLESFYFVNLGDQKLKEDYENQVLSRDRSPFKASMLWFKEQNAVDDDDLTLADLARKHRNDIAHNLPSYITSTTHSIDEELLEQLCLLLNKIDVWWLRNVEIPTNSEFDDVNADAISDTELISGNKFFLTIMMSIVKSDEAGMSSFVEDLQKKSEEFLKQRSS